MTTTNHDPAPGQARRWENRRSPGQGRSVADETRETYYQRPVIHKPHWKWEIWLYFFLGGIAGAAHVIAAIADKAGGRSGRSIVRAGRYLSFAAIVPGPILLILDLKRPERFLNMLRILKLRSPMSTGTWGLVAFSGVSALLASHQAARDGWLGRGMIAGLWRAIPARPLGLLGIAPAFFVSGYTAMLLAVTAVPLWTKNHLLIGPLFLASSMSNGAAALAVALSLGRQRDSPALDRLTRLSGLALAAELMLDLVFQRRLGPVIGRPLKEGRLGHLHRLGVIGTGIIAPLAIQTAGRATDRTAHPAVVIPASILTLLGGLAFRYLIVAAGKKSADDPRATFELARLDGPLVAHTDEARELGSASPALSIPAEDMGQRVGPRRQPESGFPATGTPDYEGAEGS